MSGSDNTPAGFVTRMTAEGPGAIAVLRVWGESAVEIVDRVFRPRSGRKRLAESAPGEIRLGWFGGDEVVALLIEDAVTGRIEVEIQGHGSELLIDSLVRLLESHGVERAKCEAFLEAHGVRKLERLAMAKLGQATTAQAAAVLYRQVSGSMRKVLSSISADLDRGEPEKAIAELDNQLNTAKFGTRLASGFRVALAGPPNVGKSTLINALAGYERAVVSPIPGTTRDAVDVSIVLEGWPIVLTDTAGLREATTDPLEAEGIHIARTEHRRADVILRLTECGQEPIELDLHVRVIDVSTKSDLARPEDVESARLDSIVISARTGEGLERLVERLVGELAPAGIAGSEAVVFDQELERSLRRIRAEASDGAIESARSSLREWLD